MLSDIGEDVIFVFSMFTPTAAALITIVARNQIHAILGLIVTFLRTCGLVFYHFSLGFTCGLLIVYNGAIAFRYTVDFVQKFYGKLYIQVWKMVNLVKRNIPSTLAMIPVKPTGTGSQTNSTGGAVGFNSFWQWTAANPSSALVRLGGAIVGISIVATAVVKGVEGLNDLARGGTRDEIEPGSIGSSTQVPTPSLAESQPGLSVHQHNIASLKNLQKKDPDSSDSGSDSD